MSSHRSLTEEYLATLPATTERAGGVTATVHESVSASSYLGRALTRPVFLGREEYRQLADDVENLYYAIVALPDRLFGGDLPAFARAVGMTEQEIAVGLRGRGVVPTRLCRVDLALDDSGFHLMELNMGSTMGGLDNALLNEGMLGQPHIADFVTRHGLSYIDTMAQTAQTLLDECGIPPRTRPTMAAADWPTSFETLAPQLHKSADMLKKLGIDAYACHVGQLRCADGRVWLDERPIDVVYRLFSMDHLFSEPGISLCEPVLAAADRGEVAMFTPVEGRLWGSKGVLALLSDDVHRHLLTEAQRRSIDRILPWTRILQSGPVSVDGGSVDLEQYVLAEQEELVLKPMLLYSGIGVVPGWLTDPAAWQEQVAAAMNGPYVVQRRIRSTPELMPTDEGLEEWSLVWGAYLMSSGAGGLWVRGTKGAASNVTNMAQGATATCCFIAND
jgi:hypothetical protein